MKPEERKTFDKNAKLWEHGFFLNNKEHGEFNLYNEKKELVAILHRIEGEQHGSSLYFLKDDMTARQFYYKGDEVTMFRWLPEEKPPRIPYKSNRTRYQTLEI